jgi:hypothetical protein
MLFYYGSEELKITSRQKNTKESLLRLLVWKEINQRCRKQSHHDRTQLRDEPAAVVLTNTQLSSRELHHPRFPSRTAPENFELLSFCRKAIKQREVVNDMGHSLVHYQISKPSSLDYARLLFLIYSTYERSYSHLRGSEHQCSQIPPSASVFWLFKASPFIKPCT